MAGRSARLDSRTHAVRPDLADVRLAERVFAPHYAAPIAMTVSAATTLRETARQDSPALAALEPGAAFEALEFTGDTAWGVAPGLGLVGYVPAAALTT